MKTIWKWLGSSVASSHPTMPRAAPCCIHQSQRVCQRLSPLLAHPTSVSRLHQTLTGSVWADTTLPVCVTGQGSWPLSKRELFSFRVWPAGTWRRCTKLPWTSLELWPKYHHSYTDIKKTTVLFCLVFLFLALTWPKRSAECCRGGWQPERPCAPIFFIASDHVCELKQ